MKRAAFVLDVQVPCVTCGAVCIRASTDKTPHCLACQCIAAAEVTPQMVVRRAFALYNRSPDDVRYGRTGTPKLDLVYKTRAAADAAAKPTETVMFVDVLVIGDFVYPLHKLHDGGKYTRFASDE